MGKHMSTRDIMAMITKEELQYDMMECPDGTVALKRREYEKLMFLNVTSSTRRIREFWTMMSMVPGLTAINQNAYLVDVREFTQWLGIDPNKPIYAQLH